MLVVENLVEADAVKRRLHVQLYLVGGAVMIAVNDCHGCLARLAIPAEGESEGTARMIMRVDVGGVAAKRASGDDGEAPTAHREG